MLEAINLSKNYGGQVFYLRFQGARCPKFSAKEGIVWSAVIQGVKNNVGSSFNDVLLLSNKIAKDNNLDLSFDSNEMMRVLHRMWKLSLVTFSETEDM